MVSHEVTRDPLYPTLTELFGQERGVEVLQRLPPPGAEPATRQDMRDVVLRMDGLEQRMSEFEQRVTRQMERFDDKLDRFHEGLRDQTRNVLLANAGMMLTLAAILIGVGVIS